MERIEISRADFEERYGIKPEPSSTGMLFFGNDRLRPIAEFIFTDEDEPDASALEIMELERMMAL